MTRRENHLRRRPPSRQTAHPSACGVSNPCFELWLLYHHEDRQWPIMDAAEAIEALRRYVPHYAKNALRMEDYVETPRRGRRPCPRGRTVSRCRRSRANQCRS